MTPLDSLKAGIKTATFVFVTGLLASLSGLLNEANEYFSKGNPIDWGIWRGTVISLALALLVGVVNAAVRYWQVAGPGIIGKVLGLFFGAVPAYPEKDTPKVVTPPPGP